MHLAGLRAKALPRSMAHSSSSSSPRPTPGFRRGKRVSDLMTPDYHAFLESSLAAERAGDAATALEYHQGIPMFARSGHVVLLRQLAGLAEEMTPWLWARWAAYQCTRSEDPGTEGSDISRAALDRTLTILYCDAMDEVHDTAGDPMRVIARTAGEDWVYHQICTYELGGLECFLDTTATGSLAGECALARHWVDARVGGYRVEPSPPGRLVVRDLAADCQIELLALGAEVHADEGGWLIGRIVPSGTTPALMFDTRPLPVDEWTARAISTGDRRGAWVTTLVEAIDDGRVDRVILQSEDRELVTDVPSLAMLGRGTAPGALASALEQLADGRDEIGRAAYRLLRSAAEGSLGSDDDAPYVAAAVVNAHGYAEAQRTLVRPECQTAWERWSQLAVDPARGRLLRLAQMSSAAAA
jgi:hypothetical protein